MLPRWLLLPRIACLTRSDETRGFRKKASRREASTAEQNQPTINFVCFEAFRRARCSAWVLMMFLVAIIAPSSSSVINNSSSFAYLLSSFIVFISPLCFIIIWFFPFRHYYCGSLFRSFLRLTRVIILRLVSRLFRSGSIIYHFACVFVASFSLWRAENGSKHNCDAEQGE